MSVAEIAVPLGGLGVIGFLAWYFFGPKQSSAAQVKGNVQEIVITVKGGYSPDVIRVKKDIPLRLVFDRKEAGDCSSRVIFPDFQASKTLAAFARTTLKFMPDKAGQFGFACGMNMLHNTRETEDKEAAERAAKRKDLTLRVVIEAFLSLPVMFAVTAHEFFAPAWLPEFPLNHLS